MGRKPLSPVCPVISRSLRDVREPSEALIVPLTAMPKVVVKVRLVRAVLGPLHWKPLQPQGSVTAVRLGKHDLWRS